jgi:hypothetical protein
VTGFQGKSWEQLLREHLEDYRGKTIHQIAYADIESRVLVCDPASPDGDMTVAVTGRLSGNEPTFIIIDEYQPLLSEELELLLKEFGAKKEDRSVPKKQPEWARHNQAPRSAKRRR